MDVGRPKHSEWNRLGFKAKATYKKDGKKVSLPFCLQCEKCIANTAAARLRSHRKVCKIDINKFKDKSMDLENSNLSTVTMEDISNPQKNNFQEIDFNTVIEKNNDPSKNPKPLRKSDKKLTNFIDQIDDLERLRIDEVLLELFIAFDIEFKNINSRYLKNLIQLLRPAYASRLPNIEKFSNDILSQVYIKHVNDTIQCFSNGILLINTQKLLISLTSDTSGKYMFVKSQETSNEDF